MDWMKRITKMSIMNSDVLRNKNVFLSGPMTGYENYNSQSFREALHRAIKAGAGHVYNPATYISIMQDKTHEEQLTATIRELVRAGMDGNGHLYDAIVMLNGWGASSGAKIEHDVTVACGIKVFSVGQLPE